MSHTLGHRQSATDPETDGSRLQHTYNMEGSIMELADMFASALDANGLSLPSGTVRTAHTIDEAVTDCDCCTRRDSAPAKRYLDGFGSDLRCWVCWDADSIRHPLTGEVRYICDRVRNNWSASRFGYPNADSTFHGVAPVCFWHNDPRDVAAGIVRHSGAHKRALTLVSGGTYADLL